MKSLTVNLSEISYDIIIEKGALKKLGNLISNISKGKKIAIITDENVDKHYGETVRETLCEKGFQVEKLVLLPGEESKSFNSLLPLYNWLLDIKITRSDLIIALGGGVIGDLTGFVAATLLRGIPFVQIPTSLLAQVDSSVGGKVAVDLEKGKNLVGSFYHPKLVIIDTSVLETLEDRFFNDGLGEVIKYALIKDEDLFNLLQDLGTREELMRHIEDIIFRCVDIKRSIVERDEKDLGERMILNFGHTFGHAIEKAYDFKGFTHGEAVAIGMYQITKISENMKITKPGTADKIKDILKKYNLPYSCDIKDFKKITEAIALDKKNLDNNLNVVLINSIGDGFIYKTTKDFLVYGIGGMLDELLKDKS